MTTTIDIERLDTDLIALLSKEEQLEIMQHLTVLTSEKGWPSVYIHRERGVVYMPHNEIEASVVYSDSPRYVLIKGGEGSGKSVAGIIKTLERLKRGCNGSVVSPDLVHMQKSLWPEFARWCPWQCVVEKHQYMSAITWSPQKPFIMAFNNAIGTQSVLLVGGAKESEIGAWEGPNLNFIHMDEFRRHKTAAALKVFDGRVRIPGPGGIPPQIFITTTPRKHWLYDYFGPLQEDDPREAFKQNARTITLLTTDNEPNLEEDFATKRAQTLTAAEARVLLNAEWEDIEAGERFIPNMLLWDMCRENIPPLEPYEPMVVAMDAAVIDDCFAIVGVTRHWDDLEKVVVRFVHVWEPKGQPLDYQGTEENPGPERLIRQLTERHNIACVVYDPYQLHDLATRLTREGIAWFKSFGQSSPRLEADQQLLSLIMQRRLSHDGNAVLRKHVDNADRKRTDDGKLRIVKREESMKIDVVVALSMCAYQCLKLRL